MSIQGPLASRNKVSPTAAAAAAALASADTEGPCIFSSRIRRRMGPSAAVNKRPHHSLHIFLAALGSLVSPGSRHYALKKDMQRTEGRPSPVSSVRTPITDCRQPMSVLARKNPRDLHWGRSMQ